jgi:hypothetical protein
MICISKEPAMSETRLSVVGGTDIGDTSTAGVPLQMVDLSPAETLLVWGARYWVKSMKERRDPIPMLNQGFGTGGVFGGVALLDQILTVTAHGSRSMRDIRCLCCKGVGDGELDILDAAALGQIYRKEALLAALNRWLQPAAAEQAAPWFRELGALMTEAGLVVFPRNPQLLLLGVIRREAVDTISATHSH